MELAEIREQYEATAARFDRMESVPEWLLFRRLRRRLFRQASGRVLEVAVGTGRNFPFYGRAVRSLVGIDLSAAMLGIALERASEAAFPVHLRVADAARLPFPDGVFDTVTSSLSTCTFPDPEGALREMARVLAPRGLILLFEHGRSSSPCLAEYQDRRADAHARALGCRWNRDPAALVSGAGLRLVDMDRVLFGIYHLIGAVGGGHE